jgi:hypothetical protein
MKDRSQHPANEKKEMEKGTHGKVQLCNLVGPDNPLLLTQATRDGVGDVPRWRADVACASTPRREALRYPNSNQMLVT